MIQIKVGLVHDFKLLREILGGALAREHDVTVVGEASDGFGAVELVRSGGIDVLVLEPLVSGKDGIELIGELKAVHAQVRILILSLDVSLPMVLRLMRAGAMGWLSKNAGHKEMISAVRALSKGKMYLPKSLQYACSEKYLRGHGDQVEEDSLTNREFQIMRMLALGSTRSEVSEKLFIGVKTVETHRANLLRKLSLRNNSELTRFAIKKGLIRA